MPFKKINSTAKWIGAIIAISIFFGGVIIAMSKTTSEELKTTSLENREAIITIQVKQAAFMAEVNTTLKHIQRDVQEIKEAVKK